jgi:hypothetical protein
VSVKNPFRNPHKEALGHAFGQLDIYYAEVRNTERDYPGLRSEIVKECDQAVANAPSAKMLASTGNLELDPDVFPTRENYQAEWEEFKLDLLEEELDERLEAIDPLTREDADAIRESVAEEFKDELER